MVRRDRWINPSNNTIEPRIIFDRVYETRSFPSYFTSHIRSRCKDSKHSYFVASHNPRGFGILRLLDALPCPVSGDRSGEKFLEISSADLSTYYNSFLLDLQFTLFIFLSLNRPKRTKEVLSHYQKKSPLFIKNKPKAALKPIFTLNFQKKKKKEKPERKKDLSSLMNAYIHHNPSSPP